MRIYAGTHDYFMLAPGKLTAGDILAIDRAYIDYEKFEEMTSRGVIYVTKMKQNLKYEVVQNTYYMNDKGQMQWREETVIFRKIKKTKNEATGESEECTIEHKARIITYVDVNKKKIIRLLTNDLEMDLCLADNNKKNGRKNNLLTTIIIIESSNNIVH